MATNTELKALITLAGKVDPSLREAMLKATGETKMLSNSLQKTKSVAGGVFKGVLSAGLISRATRALIQAGKSSISLASDLEEVQNVVDVVFGDKAGQVNTWSKNMLKGFGLAELSAKRYASTMGAMLESSGLPEENLMGLSQRLTERVADMASFYNTTTDEMFTKVQSGISGETEPLKRLGINMSVANLEAFALQKGIDQSWESLGSGGQTLVRIAYLMEKSSNAQGDFARTSGSFANQSKLAREQLSKLGMTFAKQLLPHLAAGLKIFNDFLASGKIEEFGTKFFEYGKMAYEGLKPILDLLTAIIKAAGWVIEKVGGAIEKGREAYENSAYDEYGNRIGDKSAIDPNLYTAFTNPYGKTVYMEKFAGGGLADKPSIFGEAGPEMAIPIRPGSQRSLGLLGQTAQMLGAKDISAGTPSSGGGMVVQLTQNFYISGGIDAETVAEKAGSAAKGAIESVIEKYFPERERLSYGLA